MTEQSYAVDAYSIALSAHLIEGQHEAVDRLHLGAVRLSEAG